MTRRFLLRALPVLLGLGVLLPSAQPAAAQSQDIGRQMEAEYGVLGRNSREGRVYNDMLDRAVERIVRGVNSQKRSRNFQLRSAKILGGRDAQHNNVVNAFALPDGRIYVTLGLLRRLNDSPYPEDELAFVVGHEVAHVAERHSVDQQRKSLPYFLGALLLGQVVDSQIANTAIGLGVQAKTASFSRQDEYEADRGGLIAMHRAGYNLQAAPSMLRRLKGAGDQNKFLNGVFGSHPINENRIKRVQNMIEDIRAGRKIKPD